MLGDALLAWYKANQRELPWRKNDDPYRVWVSEAMLQQTRVEAVLPRYEAFFQALPNVQALSQVDDDVLHKLWEGLGYYARAKNLKKAAQVIVAQGHFPRDPASLQALPGFGPYMAGAVASIAFHVRCAAIDGNALRIYARLALNDALVSSKQLKTNAEAFFLGCMPAYCDPGAFNQALMDLGSAICTPRSPKCPQCPIRQHCEAFAEELQEQYPHRDIKAPKKKECFDIYLIPSNDGIYIRRRAETGLLAGMWEFPHHLPAAPDEAAPLLAYTHVFTHLIWELRVCPAKAPPQIPEDWVPANEQTLRALPFPTAMRQALDAAITLLQERTNHER